MAETTASVQDRGHLGYGKHSLSLSLSLSDSLGAFLPCSSHRITFSCPCLSLLLFHPYCKPDSAFSLPCPSVRRFQSMPSDSLVLYLRVRDCG